MATSQPAPAPPNATSRPPKPPLAPSTRTTRAPLTPRIAPSASPSPRINAAPRSDITPRLTPRVKQTDTPSNAPSLVPAPGNITPRSSTRKSRVDSPRNTPTPSDERERENSATPRSLAAGRPRSVIGTTTAGLGARGDREGTPSAGRPRSVVGGGTTGSNAARNAPGRVTARPRSVISEAGNGRAASPQLLKSPVRSENGRFFHASEAREQRPALTKPLASRKPAPATFFHADGAPSSPQRPTAAVVTSPVLSAISSGPWTQSQNRIPSLPSITATTNPSRSPPLLSPTLSSLSNTSSPFFAVATSQPRSPSPSKDNIHLSYRKGASQIFGGRATATPPIIPEVTPSLETSTTPAPLHHKTPSLDSNLSSRRRSASTTLTPSPLPVPRLTHPPPPLPPTPLDPVLEAPTPLSPTKTISELASDARRERKVLDLEISNSSLLAINSSLEREVRRQKTELKRFRRLSRAGRFEAGESSGKGRAARFSEGLSVVGEGEGEGEGGEYAAFGPPSGFTDVYDDFSSSASASGSEEGSTPSSDDDDDDDDEAREGNDGTGRLARRDDKRLRGDLQKHKGLLVSSQMMNQSLKRCLYASEEMVKAGRKALEYQVRVSDVRIGGRVLTGHDEDDDQDEEVVDAEGGAEEDEAILKDDLLEQDGDGEVLWKSRAVLEGVGSEGSVGDRDSGIEADYRPTLPPEMGALLLRPPARVVAFSSPMVMTVDRARMVE